MSRSYERIRGSVESLFRADTLKATVFRGGAWLGAGSFIEQSFRFGRNMLLTRLLAPEAFGTMAIVMSATTLIQVMAEVGAREALIQNPKGSEESHLRAAWWMSFGRALSIYAFIYILAPYFSRFYANGELTGLARVATLSVVFDGAISPRAIAAVKEMKYSKWAVVANGGGIIGVLTTIVLSFFMRDVWALAIGFCSENAARCILSFFVCPWRPRFLPNLVALRDLLQFSKGLFGLAFFNLIFTRADIFILGKMYSPGELGLYSMSVYLIQTPVVFLTSILAQTLLPAFSRIQDDHPRLNRILLRVTSGSVMVGLPALVFIGFSGHSLLTLIYGQRYSIGAPALVLAAWAALFGILNAQITVMFYAKGLPQLHRRSVVLMAVLVAVLTYPFTKMFGLWGPQLACLIAVVAGYLLQVERIRKVTGLSLSEYWKSFSLPVLTSIAVAAAWFAARSTGVLAQPVANILFGICGCLAAYGFVGAIIFRDSRETA